jgi:hypothetical protein
MVTVDAIRTESDQVASARQVLAPGKETAVPTSLEMVAKTLKELVVKPETSLSERQQLLLLDRARAIEAKQAAIMKEWGEFSFSHRGDQQALLVEFYQTSEAIGSQIDLTRGRAGEGREALEERMTLATGEMVCQALGMLEPGQTFEQRAEKLPGYGGS